MTSHVATFECPFEKGLSPPLPALYLKIGRQSMLEEDELAFSSQDSADPTDRLFDARNGAHGESADCGVDTGVA